ncbi:MAG: hypothetical protein WAO08_23460 [Hyphomicrobiaceae bacterium]
MISIEHNGQRIAAEPLLRKNIKNVIIKGSHARAHAWFSPGTLAYFRSTSKSALLTRAGVGSISTSFRDVAAGSILGSAAGCHLIATLPPR